MKCKGCGKEVNPRSGLISTRRKLCRSPNGGCDKKFWDWWHSNINKPEFRSVYYMTETRQVNYWRDNIILVSKVREDNDEV